ncbi:hypothetical protein J6590_098870 [Homalodisca vitripennis]|nr:hypothetical protein J6590_098870 [Homalodisca vitripennis]
MANTRFTRVLFTCATYWKRATNFAHIFCSKNKLTNSLAVGKHGPALIQGTYAGKITDC